MRYCPVGTFDNSPAIHRWETNLQIVFKSRRDDRLSGLHHQPSTSFRRPYGTNIERLRHLRPSSKLLGYFQMSLWDKNICITFVSQWAGRYVFHRRHWNPRLPENVSKTASGDGHGRLLHMSRICGQLSACLRHLRMARSHNSPNSIPRRDAAFGTRLWLVSPGMVLISRTHG